MSHTACIYNFGRVVHHDDWNFKVPGSVFWRIYRVLQGTASVHIYGRLHTLRPGFLYMIPAFTPHEDILTGTFTHEYFHFRLDDPHVIETTDNFNLTFEAPSTPLTDAVFDRLAELCPGFELETPQTRDYEKQSSYIRWSARYKSLPVTTQTELGACVRMLLAHFMSHSPQRLPASNPRVARGKSFIDSRAGHEIMIEDAAAYAGMRPESFARAFRKAYNRTPHDYLMEKRINKAKSLLLLTAMSVKEIATACGFGDSSYFCLLFRRHTSMSPGTFRRHGDS